MVVIMPSTFSTDINFCPSCGALLPPLPPRGNLKCLSCRMEVSTDVFAANEVTYTVVINKKKAERRAKKAGDGDGQEEEGPTVERKCPNCGHDKMSYAALQLRSADEGQTVFFTCLKCKYKESENS